MKQMQAGNPITVGDVKLVPLERIFMHHDNSKKGFFIYATKEPIGVVIISPHGRYATDINGESVPLETYLQQITGLREMLNSL
jgi:hypothetical protein